ncbi:MAG TPA: NrfD/PsrC family molybdoenzyme membrane anchor subunit [Pantanalinema sp.]
MARQEPNRKRPPLIRAGYTLASVADEVSGLVLRRSLTWNWMLGFGLALLLVGMLAIAVAVLFYRGVGIWGINIPVAWGFAIGNFVWWIGIGHAGTLISAFLLLMRQKWRTSINRSAEAMTLFALVCAALFPLLHLGRPWYAYWLIPYPNTMGLWPQFRSPLVWDFFAVLTYLTVSFLFWYVGMIPDLATLRDRARHPFQRLTFGVLAMGWRGSARHWHRHQTAYLLLAALATPLVISVHSIVSLDFAAAIVPGWHSTIFPPYFVAGAVFSGFAMVLTLLIPLRAAYGLEGLITMRHVELLAKMLLATGLIVDYSYVMEVFTAWYGGNPYDWSLMLDRMTGAYAPIFWAVMLCNVGVLQLLWWPRVRANPAWLFAIALVANLGMWMERVMIVITSLHHDFLSSRWTMYYPTVWDWATLVGTVGLFFFLFFLFIRLLPVISISEVQKLVVEEGR